MLYRTLCTPGVIKVTVKLKRQEKLAVLLAGIPEGVAGTMVVPGWYE